MWFNENRQVYANVPDGACVSLKTEEQKEVSRAALQNQHFRLALAYSIDRASYIAQNLGEDLKYVCLRNGYVPGDFVSLEEDVTVDINGTPVTFEAGTSTASSPPRSRPTAIPSRSGTRRPTAATASTAGTTSRTP